jgi:hypothetical protein
MKIAPCPYLTPIVLLAALAGCSNRDSLRNITAPSGASFAGEAATRSPTQFTIGPLAITGIDQSFPDGNWHLRNVELSGPVTGGITGTASLSLKANLDQFLGSGPASGSVRIVTSTGDVFEGILTGHFQNGAPNGIQLFSSVVLHGPNGETLKAECNETSVTSETLACTGEMLSPHG